MENICIRRAVPEDCAAIVELCKALSDVVKMRVTNHVNTEALTRDRMGIDPTFIYFVADDIQTKETIGYSLHYFIYSTFDGKGIFLEELYVRPAYQSKGLGNALVKEVAKDGYVKGCNRIELNAFSWNERGVNFYSKIGAVNLTETLQINVFAIEGQDFLNLTS